MVLGLLAYIFYREGKPRLIAENGLVLRAVVLEHAVNIALFGTGEKVEHEDHDLQNALHHIAPPEGEAREEMEDGAGGERGQHHEKEHGKAHAQHHGQGDDGGLQLLAGKVLFKPQLELAGLCRFLVGEELRRVHQGFHAADHGSKEIHGAADQGHAKDGIAVLDEFQFLHLFNKVPLLIPHHDGLLFRPAHHDALDQGLTADAGAEGAGLVFGLVIFICHDLGFLSNAIIS